MSDNSSFLVRVSKVNQFTSDLKEAIDLYRSQKYDKLSGNFIKALEHFETTTYTKMDANLKLSINIFVKVFLYLFTKPDYVLSDFHGKKFLLLNPVISDLVAVSEIKTTDEYLEILEKQEDNLLKTLILYSARNKKRIPYELIFNTKSDYNSIWYSVFFLIYRTGVISKEIYVNVKEHLKYLEYYDERLFFYGGTVIYSGSTYWSEYVDKQIRTCINPSLKKRLQNRINIKNYVNKKKIGIVTDNWRPTHAVYRSIYNSIKRLRDDYELTLLLLESQKQDSDLSLFNNVEKVQIDYLGNISGDLIENDFILVYYPAIGMNFESIYLSNLRIAPIQVTGYGHPISTFGAEIDYFIGGTDVELMEIAEKNYSERLILIPGVGTAPIRPNYEIKNIKKSRNEFIINCSWNHRKFNYRLIQNLKEIVEKSKKSIIFRFFIGSFENGSGFLPFKNDLISALGEANVEILHGTKTYDEYMALKEEGDISIDAHHYGGYTTVIESLYLRKPTVTFEGRKAYNRVPSQILRIIGLDELIGTNEKSYIEIILKLIHNDGYRTNLCKRIQNIDLERRIFNSDDHSKYFKKAIDFLIENHDRLKNENSRRPITIT